jgi:serine/threonine protein kinase
MEQMERDLIALSNSPKEANSSNIARLGLQILDGLRWIHQKGYLFIDVKPDNFMLKGDFLYFVDCKT